MTRFLHSLLALLLFSLLALGFTPSKGRTDTTRRESRRALAFKDVRCQIPWRKGTEAVRRLVRCVADVLPNVAVPDALAVAACESGFNARAYNPGGYGGVFQQDVDEWPKRAALFGFKGRPWSDAEANTWVSLRAVRYSGWGPWECKP